MYDLIRFNVFLTWILALFFTVNMWLDYEIEQSNEQAKAQVATLSDSALKHLDSLCFELHLAPESSKQALRQIINARLRMFDWEQLPDRIHRCVGVNT